MEPIIRVLMVEDNAFDVELIKREIKKNNISFVHHLVETKEDFIEGLNTFHPDIILSDYTLPAFNGMEALAIRQTMCPDIPFVLCTGSINEETAVNVMKAGADDYILKGHITRIGSAMLTALQNKANLRLKKQTDEQLRIFSRAVEQNPASIIITNIQGEIEYVNQKFTKITGYSFQEVLGKNPRILKSGFMPPNLYKDLWQTITKGKEWHGELQNRKKNGQLYDESVLIAPIANDKGEVAHFLAVKEDITEKRKAQVTLEKNQILLKKALFESSQLIDVTTGEVNYQTMADIIRDLSEAQFVVFNLFNENSLDFKTVAIAGIKEDITKAMSILGFEVLNKTWTRDSILEERIKGAVITRFDSVIDMAQHVISRTACRLIDTVFKINELHVVNIRKNNKGLGAFYLIYTQDNLLKNNEIVSIFANQIGLYVDRKRAEDALIKKMNELERFHRLTVDRELAMIELKKEVNSLLKESGQDPKYHIVQ
ncbi:hybrid sensor histidine kinase/response regulator [Microbacter margulisiae]|uniref:PAS domain S-box-containing protein n=1 Tax=Microbacter margulisiae TaxID=1350067 RepID=A0A7W5H2X2_9PORP|nr:hybrid sensor histidine kinase/response regulator [Microbacter margulisiae]MBB3188225.1 PAS domain S-box-containing protein [Microbacter margulisiae]